MDEKTLKDFTKKRSELIASLMSSMDGQVKDNQKKLLEKVLEKFVDKLEKDENGNVKNNDRNRNLLIQFDDIFKEYQKKEARDTVGLLLQSVGSIINFNQKYFSALDGQARTLPIIPKVKDFMKVWLGIKGDIVEPNGYLDKLVSNDQAKIALKNQAMKIVIGQEGFEDAKKQIKTLIDGNQNTMGALEKHHRNFAFDLYSQIDRATSDVIRNDLGFVFAIYEGGLIETSRTFCEEHDGNIYHISEIKDFNPTEAKPPNYNPITDLGGYGCRHHLNWISTAMAKAMGKDVDKFLKGGQNKGNTTVEEEKQKPKPTEKPKKKEEPKKPSEIKISEIKTTKEAKAVVQDIFPKAKSVSISSKIEMKDLIPRIEQLKKLNDKYILDIGNLEKINFSSGTRTLGVVKSYLSGNIKEANFGSREGGWSMHEKRSDPKSDLQRHSANIDKENHPKYTTTHEFAHLLTTLGRKGIANNDGVVEFWSELRKVFSEYLKELNSHRISGEYEKASEIFIGKYGHTNTDEFFAESFTQYELNSKPTKYSKKVGELVEKYFKKTK
jgi:hypothetical protein